LPQWNPYESGKRTMMLFDNQSRVVHDFHKEQRLIFERINAARS